MAYLLKKEDFPLFVKLLLKSYDVVAPVKQGKMTVFSQIGSYKDIDLSRNSYYPPKKYFLPAQENLLKYRKKRALLGGEKDSLDATIDNKKKVIFGMRMCDVSATSKLDKFYTDDIMDQHYRERRDNIFIIALKCETEENDNCFFSSFEFTDSGYDLYFARSDEGFIVEVKTDKGKSLIDKKIFKASARDAGKDLPDCERKLISTKVAVHSPAWQKYADDCLSCCACNIVCPTCSCFDLKDYPNLDLKTGNRKRLWDYCQSADFTKVAGNHIFRQGRTERFKHRLLCKFKYFKENFDEITCTGCGRCVTVCPTNVCDIPKILSDVNG